MNKQLTNVQRANHYLVNNPDFARLVPGTQRNGERMMALLRVHLETDPKLRACSIESLTKCAVIIAATGIEPGIQNNCWIIPRSIKGNMTACLQFGYGGLLALAYRSGEVAKVHCDTVCANDECDVVNGEWSHRYDPKACRGNVVGYVCVITLNNKHTKVEYMTREQVETIRKNNADPKSGAWKDNYDEMAKKTVLRRALKTLPATPQDQRLMQEVDDMDYERELPTEVTVHEQREGESRAAAVHRIISAPREEVSVPETSEMLFASEEPTESIHHDHS